jgi:hypothetical protein
MSTDSVVERVVLDAKQITAHIETREQKIPGGVAFYRRVMLDLTSIGCPSEWEYDGEADPFGDVVAEEELDNGIVTLLLHRQEMTHKLPERVRLGSDQRLKGTRPAFFCKHCGWSEDPSNPWQVRASDHAFHAPCPAHPDDPGMAETPHQMPFDEPPF